MTPETETPERDKPETSQQEAVEVTTTGSPESTREGEQEVVVAVSSDPEIAVGPESSACNTTDAVAIDDPQGASRPEPELINNNDIKKSEVGLPSVPPQEEAAFGPESNEFPDAFYCPITKMIMKDPVVDVNGDSYERTAIMERDASLSHEETALGLAEGGGKDGGIKNTNPTYYTNRALKAVIDQALLDRAERRNTRSLRGTLRRLDKSMRKTMRKLLEQSAIPHSEFRPLPDVYYCPITFDLISYPIIDKDGNTFEGIAIQKWIQKNGSSPITRNPLTFEDLRPNHSIQELLDAEKERTELSIHPSIRRWKDAEPPQPPDLEATMPTSNTTGNISGGTDTARQEQFQYPTTEEELVRRRNQRRTIVSCGFVAIFFALILGFMSVPYAFAVAIILILVLVFCCCKSEDEQRVLDREYASQYEQHRRNQQRHPQQQQPQQQQQ